MFGRCCFRTRGDGKGRISGRRVRDQVEQIRQEPRWFRRSSIDLRLRLARVDGLPVLPSRVVCHLVEVAIGLLGRDVTSLLRLDGTTPRDPVVLARYAGEVASALETAKLPKSRVRGAKFHAEDWATRLRDGAKALGKTLDTVAREAREAEATLVAKNRALDEYDGTFANVATLVSGLLRIGGDAELAARVRPSLRRPGQTIELAEDTVAVEGGEVPVPVSEDPAPVA